jgi:hypothetical protein
MDEIDGMVLRPICTLPYYRKDGKEYVAYGLFVGGEPDPRAVVVALVPFEGQAQEDSHG